MDIALLTNAVEEISRTYANRFSITRDSAWFLLKLHEEVGEFTQAHLMREGQTRNKGMSGPQVETAFRAEVADVFAHILLLAHHHGIDVATEVEQKWLAWRTPDTGEQSPG